MSRRAKGSGFKMRSTNKTTFKMMGSSPARQNEDFWSQYDAGALDSQQPVNVTRPNVVQPAGPSPTEEPYTPEFESTSQLPDEHFVDERAEPVTTPEPTPTPAPTPEPEPEPEVNPYGSYVPDPRHSSYYYDPSKGFGSRISKESLDRMVHNKNRGGAPSALGIMTGINKIGYGNLPGTHEQLTPEQRRQQTLEAWKNPRKTTIRKGDIDPTEMLDPNQSSSGFRMKKSKKNKKHRERP